MEQLSPAEMAMLQSWYDYVHSHKPHFNESDESQNDTFDRTRLFYLMTEITCEYYKQCDVDWYNYEALRIMGVDNATLCRWRKRWRQKLWANLHFSALKMP